METEKVTLAEAALANLRQDIVCGFFKPGQSLRIEVLKDRYEMGASPLREALSKLATEGFVVNEANRGFRVSPMSREDLADITLVRQTVEMEAVKRSIEQGGDEWEVGIVAALRRLTLAARKHYDSTAERVVALDMSHWQFHRSIVAGCSSSRLLELQEIYYRQGVRYRQVMLDGMVDTEEFVSRHENLADTVLTRDVATAQQLLRDHIELTVDEIYPAQRNSL